MDDYENVDCVFSWTIDGDILTLKTIGISKVINMQKWQVKSFYITTFTFGTYVRIAFYDGSAEKFEIDPSMLDQCVPLLKKFAQLMNEVGKKRNFNINEFVEPILSLDDNFSFDDMGNQDTDVDRGLCLSYKIHKRVLYVQSQGSFMFLDLSDVTSFTSDTSILLNFGFQSGNVTFYSDLSMVNSKKTYEFIESQVKLLAQQVTKISSKKDKCVIC